MSHSEELNDQIAQNLKIITAEVSALQEKLQALQRQLTALEAQTADLTSAARPRPRGGDGLDGKGMDGSRQATD